MNIIVQQHCKQLYFIYIQNQINISNINMKINNIIEIYIAYT